MKNILLDYTKAFLQKDSMRLTLGASDLEKVLTEGINGDDEKRDEILCSFGFMVIAIERELGEKNIVKVAKEINGFIEGYSDKRGGPPGEIEEFFRFEMYCDKEFQKRLEDFFDTLLRNICADFNKQMEEIIDVKILLDRVNAFCKIMGERCIRGLANEFSPILYSHIWNRVFNYAIKKGITTQRKCSWFYKNEVVNYGNLFAATILGLIVLLRRLSSPRASK